MYGLDWQLEAFEGIRLQNLNSPNTTVCSGTGRCPDDNYKRVDLHCNNCIGEISREQLEEVGAIGRDYVTEYIPLIWVLGNYSIETLKEE